MQTDRWSQIIVALHIICLLGATLAFAQQPEQGTYGKNRQPGQALEVGDPISAASGGTSFSLPLLNLGGPLGLDFTLIYDQDSNNMGAIGFSNNIAQFWHSQAVMVTLEADAGGLNYIHLPNGVTLNFEKNGSGDLALKEDATIYPGNALPVRYQMKDSDEYVYALDPAEGRVYLAEKARCDFMPNKYRLRYVLDRNGNQLVYEYDAGSACELIRIHDTLGRSLNFTYSTVGMDRVLHTVADQAGRQVQFTFERPAADNGNQTALRSVTDPMSQTYTFTYQSDVLYGNITQVKYPRNNIPYTTVFARHSVTLPGSQEQIANRAVSQTDAYGHVTEMSYVPDAYRTTVDYPDETQEIYAHASAHTPPTGLTDANSNAIAFTQNALHQITGVTDRLGDATTFTYHPDTGMLASATNALGQTLTYTYTPQDQTFTNPLNSETVTFTLYNLTRITYPDSSYEAFTYDGHGNLLTRTDQAGQTWTYTYNGLGQVLTSTDPDGSVSTNTYNADGTLATSRDSDTTATTYGYDVYKRLTSITSPGGSSVTIAYNLNDQITALTDENGHVTEYAYDANGNLTGVTDAKDNTTQYAYDLMDRVTQITDRLGKSGTTTYDSRSRVASITDPNGLQTAYTYDGHGWRTGVTVAGQTWTTAYDAEGVTTSSTTPLNRQTTYASDKLGRTTGVTDPLNQTTTLAYDALGRLASVADPLNRVTTYAYDARGLLNKVTLPNGQFASYAYTNGGLLSTLTDLNNQTWQFGYTAAGRWSATTDPLGRQITQTYTTRGWPSVTTYPGGVTLTRTYDAAGNVTQNAYSTGLSLNYTYDELNRLTAADGVSLEYDAEGQLTASVQNTRRFAATYDNGGRLATVSYNNSALTVTYTYNARGLLAQVSDNLGNAVTFTYDDDHRLTGLTRSNGVNGVYDYDAAGQRTRLREGTFTDLNFTYNAAGEIASANLTLPLDPAASLTTGATALTYDAASQISSAGYTHDGLGRLTAHPGATFAWDAASRLTGVNGVTLEYNGLDNLTRRVDDSAVTQFFYHHAIGLSPIAAELDGSGAAQRYYVWTPGGQLLWMVDAAQSNAVAFYHFDQIGTTLALSNGSGAVTDAYAYDPSGHLLAHTGTSAQPFTFLGQWGARQEGSSGALYHIRARYYDAATGRFVSREPLWPNLGDPAQNNPYQYARNNPIRFFDADGLSPNDALSALSESYYYAPDAKTFIKYPATPVPPRGGSFRLSDGALCVLGGNRKGSSSSFSYGLESNREAAVKYLNRQKNENRVFRYDPDTSTFTEIKPDNRKKTRAWHMIFGGARQYPSDDFYRERFGPPSTGGNSYKNDHDVYEYNPDSGTFTKIENEAYAYSPPIYHNGQQVVLGGTRADGPSNAVFPRSFAFGFTYNELRNMQWR